MVLAERLLQRGEIGIVRDALDGDDAQLISLHREHQTRTHRCAIDEHGACATHTMRTRHMSAGQPRRVAQTISERHTRLDVDAQWLTVHLDPDLHWTMPQLASSWCGGEHLRTGGRLVSGDSGSCREGRLGGQYRPGPLYSNR